MARAFKTSAAAALIGALLVVAAVTLGPSTTTASPAPPSPPARQLHQAATGTLTVTLSVTNDDLGKAPTSDFTVRIDQSAVAAGSAQQVSAGIHVVDVRGPDGGPPEGYDVEFGADCDDNGIVTVDAGQTQTCSVTLDDVEPGTVTVTKVVTAGPGGSAPSMTTDFSFLLECRSAEQPTGDVEPPSERWTFRLRDTRSFTVDVAERWLCSLTETDRVGATSVVGEAQDAEVLGDVILTVTNTYGSALGGDLPASGLGLIVYGGGSVSALVNAAVEVNVEAIFSLSGGTWFAFIVGAPSAVNAAFEALYAAGVPASTPLIVRVGSPSSPPPTSAPPPTSTGELMLVWGQHLIPLSQLREESSHSGCDATHWHAIGDAVLTAAGQAVFDPAPTKCGFGVEGNVRFAVP